VQGDIKKPDEDMYKDLVKELPPGKEVILAFNKVDAAFDSCLTQDYFKKHREKTARVLKCKGSNIFYISLKMSSLNVGAKDQLKNAGVLSAEQFRQIVLQLEM
jgi:hypothetical protein